MESCSRKMCIRGLSEATCWNLRQIRQRQHSRTTCALFK